VYQKVNYHFCILFASADRHVERTEAKCMAEQNESPQTQM